MTGEMTLVFSNLYDDVWAAFPKSNRYKSRFQPPTIIFPHDFVPEVGKKYRCRVTDRMYATYMYQDKMHKVAYAMPKEMGNMVDFFHYQLDVLEKREGRLQGDGGSTMKAAFEKLLEGDEGFEEFAKERKLEADA